MGPAPSVIPGDAAGLVQLHTATADFLAGRELHKGVRELRPIGWLMVLVAVRTAITERSR